MTMAISSGRFGQHSRTKAVKQAENRAGVDAVHQDGQQTTAWHAVMERQKTPQKVEVLLPPTER